MINRVVPSTQSELKPTRHRMFIVGILFVTFFIAYLDRVNVSVLLADNTFLTDMGIKGKPLQMGMLMSAFLISYGVANVVLSPLGDILGPRKAMCIAIALWTASLVLGGIASVFTTLIIARIILGFGEGMHWPMQSKFVKNWFPPNERGSANAVWLQGLKLGPAFAMPFFAWFLSVAGWRESFFALAIMGILPLLLLWFFTTDHPHQSKLVNRAELAYIADGLASEQGAIAKKTTLWENIKSFATDYRFWLTTIFYTCSASIYWGIMAWLPNYLKTARGFSWAEMGAWTTFSYAMAAATVLIFGYLSDKAGRRAPFCALAMVCSALGVYLGAHAENNTLAALYISLGNASLGIGTPVSWALLQDIVSSKSISTAAGVMNGVSSGGAALSPILIGFYIGITGSYADGLMYLVATGIVGACCMLILVYKKY